MTAILTEVSFWETNSDGLHCNNWTAMLQSFLKRSWKPTKNLCQNSDSNKYTHQIKSSVEKPEVPISHLPSSYFNFFKYIIAVPFQFLWGWKKIIRNAKTPEPVISFFFTSLFHDDRVTCMKFICKPKDDRKYSEI